MFPDAFVYERIIDLRKKSVVHCVVVVVRIPKASISRLLLWTHRAQNS